MKKDKIVELLTEMVLKQDQMLGQLNKLWEEQAKTNLLLQRHENDLLKIAELLDNSVPKFDQVIRLENISDNRVIIKKD